MKCRMSIFAILLVAPVLKAAPPPSCDVFPGSQAAGPVYEYNVDTLFEYMDGQSEGYFSYGFNKLTGVTCKKGDLKLIVDIFEMTDPEAAWGVLASLRDPRLPYADIGTGGQLRENKAMFAKGKYWVEITAEPEDGHAAVVEQAARTLEKSIAGETRTPPELEWFPEQGLDKKETRLVPQSVLGIPLLKRGYLAQYDDGMRLFLVREASPEGATKLLEQLKARFQGQDAAGAGDGAIQGENRYLGKLFIFRKGSFVAGIVKPPESADAAKLAAAFAAKLP
jgi:Family of unknown function (DUF6599)